MEFVRYIFLDLEHKMVTQIKCPQPLTQRAREELLDWLLELNFIIRADIEPIDDTYLVRIWTNIKLTED